MCVLDARQQADLMFFISENAISLNVYSIRESLSAVSQSDQFTCFYHAFGAIARADCQLVHFWNIVVLALLEGAPKHKFNKRTFSSIHA